MKATFVYLDGTPFENGKRSGELYREGLQRYAPKFEARLNDPVYRAATIRILELTEEAFPVYVEECRGRAEGAELPFETFWAMMCTELNRITTGCTSILVKREDGSTVIAHNEDDEDLEGYLSIAKIKTDYGYFCTSDIYNMPFGNGYSWNSHGIMKTINYMHDPLPIAIAIPRYFAQRHISEASSIEDFIERSKAAKWGSGFHAFVFDRNTGEAVSVECSTEGLEVKRIDSYAVHSNHYLLGKYKDNVQTSGHGNYTVFRYLFTKDKVRDLIESKTPITMENLREILNFRDPQGRDELSIMLPFKEDGNVTIGGISFDSNVPDKVMLHFHPQGEQHYVNYDLSDILEGK